MLIKNGKQVDLTQPEFAEVKKKIDEIRSKTSPFQIRARRAIPTIIDENGRRVKPPLMRGQSIPMKATISDPNTGTAEWMYVENLDQTTQNNDGRITGFRFSKSKTIYDHHSLDRQRDYELIYFLTELSEFYPKTIYHYDPKEEADKKFEIESLETDVKWMIMSDKSPLSAEQNKGDDTRIRELAARWGVKGVKDMSYNQVKLALRDAVVFSEKNKKKTKKGFIEFLDDCDDSKQRGRDGLISTAISKGVLEFSEDDGMWYLNAKGGERRFVIAVDKEDYKQKEHILKEYFNSPLSQRNFEYMEEAVNSGNEVRYSPPKEESSDPESDEVVYVYDLKRDKIFPLAREYNIPIVRRKLNAIREDLIKANPKKFR